ncbi:MAG: nicotinate-nucleotide adenylyltransferase [Halanaerobiaceae bacterium]
MGHRNFAIMGGTFDPVHMGHLLIAEQAYNNFELDRIIFMPAGFPPHKTDRSITAAYHRLNMLKIAIEDNPHFTFSCYELKKRGKSYTAETLRYFKQLPSSNEFDLIIGADSLAEIFTWKEPEYILGQMRLIVASRPGYSPLKLLKEPHYKKYIDNIAIMDEVKADISSSFIRRELKNNRSIRYLVPDRVIEYINKNNLYRSD